MDEESAASLAHAAKERVFGESGSGRSKWLSEGVKVEQLHGDYDPCGDTCLAAFVCLMAAQASA